MSKIEYEKFKFDHFIQTLTDEELFGQWLRNFFYLNNELNKEYDTFYQNSFYIIFFELTTVGIKYSKKVLSHLKNSHNFEKKDFYTKLISGLTNLKSLFSESELEFIEYKRHSSSHIFQKKYQKRISEKGKILTKRKGKLIDELNLEFREILFEHGFDRGFDVYMSSKIYPKAHELYTRLNEIKTHYTMYNQRK